MFGISLFGISFGYLDTRLGFLRSHFGQFFNTALASNLFQTPRFSDVKSVIVAADARAFSIDLRRGGSIFAASAKRSSAKIVKPTKMTGSGTSDSIHKSCFPYLSEPTYLDNRRECRIQ